MFFGVCGLHDRDRFGLVVELIQRKARIDVGEVGRVDFVLRCSIICGRGIGPRDETGHDRLQDIVSGGEEGELGGMGELWIDCISVVSPQLHKFLEDADIDLELGAFEVVEAVCCQG